jgi:hypothetical protein
MNSQTRGLKVASFVFGLISLLQLARLIIQPGVMFEGHQVPLWPSALAFVIFGGLSYWMGTLARGTTGKRSLRFNRQNR